MAETGFEPAPPKRPEPYSGALDQLGHSTGILYWESRWLESNQRPKDNYKITVLRSTIWATASHMFYIEFDKKKLYQACDCLVTKRLSKEEYKEE
jgi:hypothetical protein